MNVPKINSELTAHRLVVEIDDETTLDYSLPLAVAATADTITTTTEVAL
ncbi:MAG TPA: hypothetical protein PLK80_04870 [bacterium]|nr:hypothetical protein [bacterium]HPI76045.1 hypothetical protein [bacterium]